MENEKIRYYYSSMSKQVMLIILGILILLRFILMVQIKVYNINDYGVQLNMGATSVLYVIYFTVCVFFLIAYRFFATEFNQESITYRNLLLKSSHTVEFTKVNRAHLSKRGIFLHGEGSREPLLYLPFFRFGVISPVGVDKLYKLLKEENVEIQKDFVELPGHGKKSKWVKVIYACMALYILGYATQTLALVVAIFKSH